MDVKLHTKEKRLESQGHNIVEGRRVAGAMKLEGERFLGLFIYFKIEEN